MPNQSLAVALLTSARAWSGVEVHTLALAKSLRDRGHSVVIVELNSRVYAAHAGKLGGIADVRSIDIGAQGQALGTISLLEWVKAFSGVSADIAVIAKGTFDFGNLAMEAAAWWCFPKLCVIEHLHATLEAKPRPHFKRFARPSLGLWWYRARLSGQLRSIFPHRVFCVSRAVSVSLEDDFGYPIAKLKVMYAGVDTDCFGPDQKARSIMREAWGISSSALVFGSVGRLSAMKNHLLLIDGFARAFHSRSCLDVHLVIVGEGQTRDRLKQRIEQLGLVGRVHLPGFSSKTHECCAAFDVICLTSSSGESFGIALIEGLASGAPAIATAVGGVPEILDDESIGWLTPPGDVSMLARAMKSASELGRGELARMGERARASAIARFSGEQRWGMWAEAIECEAERQCR